MKMTQSLVLIYVLVHDFEFKSLNHFYIRLKMIYFQEHIKCEFFKYLKKSRKKIG